MNNLMSKFLKSSLIGSVGLAVLGALLIFQSEFAILSISYIIGAILVAVGVLAILGFIKNMSDGTKNELDIVYGIVTIIMGIIVISNPQAIASIIPFVIGVIIIISSAAKLQYSLELKQKNNPLWKSTAIISIITLLCGVLLVFNPFKGAELFTAIIGLLMLTYSILDIISTVTIRNTVKQIHTAIEEHIVEAEVVEEKDSTEEEKPSEEKEVTEEAPNHQKRKTKRKEKKDEKKDEEK